MRFEVEARDVPKVDVLGSILAPPLVAFLSIHFGWRWAFIVTGGLGLVLFAVWQRVYHSPERHPRLTAEERELILADHRDAARNRGVLAPVDRVSMLALFRQPACVGFFVARLLTDPITYFFAFWLPSYLKAERGFTLALMLFAASCMPAAIVAVLVPSAWISIACIAIVLGAQSCWMANQLTLISESVPRSHVASLLALSAMGGSIGGIAANLLAGRAIAAAGYVPVFCVIAFCHLTAFVVLLMTARSKRLP